MTAMASIFNGISPSKAVWSRVRIISTSHFYNAGISSHRLTEVFMESDSSSWNQMALFWITAAGLKHQLFTIIFCLNFSKKSITGFLALSCQLLVKLLIHISLNSSLILRYLLSMTLTKFITLAYKCLNVRQFTNRSWLWGNQLLQLLRVNEAAHAACSTFHLFLVI